MYLKMEGEINVNEFKASPLEREYIWYLLVHASWTDELLELLRSGNSSRYDPTLAQHAQRLLEDGGYLAKQVQILMRHGWFNE